MAKTRRAHFQKDAKGRPIRSFICSSAELAKELSRECDWFSTVPDSMFRNLLGLLRPCTVAPRENHAYGMAFGARLGGRKSCVLIQNSGLGLSGDAIYGLFGLYRVGVLSVVALRGELEWEEPQHLHWGRKTLDYLATLDIPGFDLQEEGLAAVRGAARVAFLENRPSALLIHRGNIDE